MTPMNVAELIEMLKGADPEARVIASDIYGDGQFSITGMVHDSEEVNLTGERDQEHAEDFDPEESWVAIAARKLRKNEAGL
jgi:hypothetical protein